MKNRFVVYFLLFLIIFMALLFRIYHINQRSLWYDEASSVSFALEDIKSFFSSGKILRPLYYIILKAWIEIFSIEEISVRILSVFFSLLSVYLLFKVGALLFNRRVGLYSSLILSLSTFHIMWSQQARPYTLFTSLAIASVLLFYRILIKPTNRNYLLYLFANILLIYTHLYGIYLILVQNLFLLIFFRNRIMDKKWILTQSIILLCCILLVPLFIRYPYLRSYGIQKSRQDFQILKDTLESFTYGGKNIAQGGLSYEIEPEKLTLPKLLIYIFGFFYLLGLIPSKKSKNDYGIYIKEYHRQIFLILWLFLPIIISFLISFFFPWTYLVRYVIFTSPAYYLGIGVGLNKIKFKYQVFSIIIIFLLSLVSLSNYYYPQNVASWKELSKDVRENIEKDDIILFAPLAQISPFWYYYKGKSKEELQTIGWGIEGRAKLINGVWHSQFSDGSNIILGPALDIDKTEEFISRESLRKFSQKHKNIWLVISPDWIGKNNALLLHKYLSTNYIMSYKKMYSFEGIEVYKYTKK